MQIDLEPITPTEALELYLTDRRGHVIAWPIRVHRSRLFTFINRIAVTVAAATGDCREALALLLRAARLAEHQNKVTDGHAYRVTHSPRHEPPNHTQVTPNTLPSSG